VFLLLIGCCCSGWNIPQVLQHGWSMVELFVEVLMGQFSYEAAQQPLQPPPSAVPAAAFGMPFGHGSGMMPQSPPAALQPHPHLPPPLDEFTLPSTKVIHACMRIVYHLLESGPLDSPASSTEVAAVTATRASILAYQQRKYAEHSDSMLVKLRVDWHLFGLLQHCFTRWAHEWDTTNGMMPVLVVSAASAATPVPPSAAAAGGGGGGGGGLSSYSSTPAKYEDRLTKLVELWLDYLEPWKSIYSEEFHPLLWRWWIVANLPFYTVLLRDFLRLLAARPLDLGREQTPQRTAHLKTVLHLLKIFEGPVLEHVEDVEATLLRSVQAGGAGTTNGLGGGGHFQAGRDAQQNQQTQQETCQTSSTMHMQV
jgi:hypothetical protein